ncbi:TPM domain-containing protein [Paenibacillus sp. PL2-23]|uniref:TPM domain-containing protein n=1 Tax=Paenibacillus sp. PL2-23 TaxID=2100729 RepID=UPI0030F60D69
MSLASGKHKAGRGRRRGLALGVIVTLLLSLLWTGTEQGISSLHAAESDSRSKQLVFDQADLLDAEQESRLEEQASRYGAERQTDMVIYTTLNEAGADVMKLTQDFYDEQGFGYDKRHGNAVVVTVDMYHREVYLAGFYKGQEYLDDNRLDRIRSRMTPKLTAGDYEGAFLVYIQTAHRYMGYEPGVNPDNIVFNVWFQAAVAAVIAWLVVWRLTASAGGKVTVHRRTYENASTSGVTGRQDMYVRTTVTKQRIPRSNGGAGGGGRGGGGGMTSGGHSHSGSRGSF